MKYKLLLFSCLIISFACTVAPSSSQSETETLDKITKTDLCKRWILDFGLMNNEKIGGLPSTPAFDYEFKNDGVYLLYQANGNYTEGIWEFNDSCNCYKLYRKDSELNGQIKMISKNEFVLKPDGESAKMSPQGLKYHYKPK